MNLIHFLGIFHGLDSICFEVVALLRFIIIYYMLIFSV